MQNYKIEFKYIYVSFSTACICVIKSKGDPRIPLFHQKNFIREMMKVENATSSLGRCLTTS